MTEEEYAELADELDRLSEILQRECFRFSAAVMRRTAKDIRNDDAASRLIRKGR